MCLYYIGSQHKRLALQIVINNAPLSPKGARLIINLGMKVKQLIPASLRALRCAPQPQPRSQRSQKQSRPTPLWSGILNTMHTRLPTAFANEPQILCPV
jgi:hypothetical protein